MIRIVCTFAALLGLCAPASAQILSYPNPNLDYIYPAGGKQGQAVALEFGGVGGLDGAKSVIIDGPPGITVSEVKAVSGSLVKALFTIAPDAAPGRRFVRVVGGSNGLTNFRYFFVGNLPEVMEKEPNNKPAEAQEVVTPVVINGRIEKELDVDCFRFQAKAGQRLMLGLLAHRMDSGVRLSFNTGFLDTSLELLDDKGNILADADDTLGLDPVLTYTPKADGSYTVRVQSLSYKGSPASVYRLTICDVSQPTTVFPPGGQRGKDVAAEVTGFNLDKPLPRKLKVPAEGSYPLHFLPMTEGPTDGYDLPLIRGDHPEIVETEPNNGAKQATAVTLPVTINGRIDKAGDEDWFRVSLKKGQGVLFDVTAQRLLRSPIDTMLEIYDAAGKKLAENDDGTFFAHQCAHDFVAADSWLTFTAPADGDYFVRLRDQSGVGGHSAVYRLAITDLQPAFVLYQWPDAVPIWGPGTTAAFIVEIYHWGIKSDVEFRVEGLPPGWTGSTAKLSLPSLYMVPNGMKAFLTITAPANAPIGTTAPFRVIGKIQQDGKTIEREVQYLTLYGNAHNDRMFLRPSPSARAVVADFMDAWPTTTIKELTVTHGETVQIPVSVQRKPGAKAAPIGIVVNGPTVAAGCGLGIPIPMKADQDTLMLPLTISPEVPVGPRGIVIARSWTSDIRGGRPGPCTPIILLNVKAKGK